MNISKKVLVTGGAGFIGANLVARLVREGCQVTIFDNFSRLGCSQNLKWLQSELGEDGFDVIRGELADVSAVSRAVANKECIYHLAGQVAVTTSVRNPRMDFEHNALGTFNILEAARLVGDDPIILYASTNKVYGDMNQTPTAEGLTRYEYQDLPFGVSEAQPLDFHSPYGCSKGCGDQYVRDYARIFGLRTVVVRQSCIYGCRQLGIEDQGWIAWFMIAALSGRDIKIYGNGKQVRDVLFVDDLLDLYAVVIRHIDVSAGQIYNVGGGPANTLSIWAEFGRLLGGLMGKDVPATYCPPRPGDQPIYISDIRKAERELGWYPAISAEEGITRLFHWIRSNQSLFDGLKPIEPIRLTRHRPPNSEVAV